MRRPQHSAAALSAAAALLALPSLVSGVSYDCKDIRVDRKDYDLSTLGGPRMVHWIQDQPPSVSNFTFTIDVCKNLDVIKDIPKQHQCPSGTRVCGIETTYRPSDNETWEDGRVEKTVPIAGTFTWSSGKGMDPKFTRLQGSDSNADAEKEGLRMELGGGKFPFTKKKGVRQVKQKALVEFVCDHNRTGLEGGELDQRDTVGEGGEEEEKEERRRRRLERKMRVRDADAKDDDDDDSDDDDDDDDDDDKRDDKRSLRFVSYKEEHGIDVLRLEWLTKYACEDGGKDSGPGSSKSEHWGFFTWVIIIIFLCTSAYLIFGSWLNYERYGARGWDAVPHGDTIRDLPYLIKDFGRRVTSSVQGGGSRGGYSAV